ncbi:MAG: SelB C-terminal domain-containing protein, partial [Zoogloea sp.]|nr:SelB C-terminal domain-containing protein [Zoogloea sp.]
ILGGGTVLSPRAPQSHKRQPLRLARLREMNRQQSAEILRAWLAAEGPPIDLHEFKAAINLQDVELDALLALPALATHMRVRKASGDWLLSQEAWIRHRDTLYQQVNDWHVAHPMDAGMPQARLLQVPGGRLPAAFAVATLEALLQEKRLQVDGALVRCAHYRPALSPVLEAAWQRLQGFLIEGGFRIPLLSEIERELRLGPKVQTAVIATALKAGKLLQVSPKRVTLPAVLLRLAAEINRLASQQELFTVIEAKTHLDLGRDLTIEILEYFDRIHFTQRQGNARRVRDADLPQKMFA